MKQIRAPRDMKRQFPRRSIDSFDYKQFLLNFLKWMNLSSVLHPEQWGWRLILTVWNPAITTDLPLAPDSLLKAIRCPCKTAATPDERFRRRGLEGSVSCGVCNSLTCTNCSIVLKDDDLDASGPDVLDPL